MGIQMSEGLLSPPEVGIISRTYAGQLKDRTILVPGVWASGKLLVPVRVVYELWTWTSETRGKFYTSYPIDKSMIRSQDPCPS